MSSWREVKEFQSVTQELLAFRAAFPDYGQAVENELKNRLAQDAEAGEPSTRPGRPDARVIGDCFYADAGVLDCKMEYVFGKTRVVIIAFSWALEKEPPLK